MTLRRAHGAALMTAVIALSACVSVPDDLRADLQPPDGVRANNYGRLVEQGGGPVVRPDRPTIAAVGSRGPG